MTTTPSLTLRRYRGIPVMGLVLALHALVLYGFIFGFTAAPSSAPERSILLTTIIDQTYPRPKEKLPTPKAQLKPATVVLDTSDLRIGFSPALVPPKTPTEQIAGRSGSSLVSGAPAGSQGQPGSNENGVGAAGPVVLNHVAPDFSSVPSSQRGTVWVRALIDKSGHVGTAEVEQTSSWPLIDQAALHAVRQWRFEPQTSPVWKRVGFTYMGSQRDLPTSLLHIRIVLDTFNPTFAEEIQAAAASSSNSTMPTRVSSKDVSRLIALLQKYYASQSRTLGVSWARQFPMQGQLVAWGDIQSVQLLGVERVGLASDSAAQNSLKEAQWQLYAVKQQGGAFIWLVGINTHDHIDALEGLACVTTCLPTIQEK